MTNWQTVKSIDRYSLSLMSKEAHDGFSRKKSKKKKEINSNLFIFQTPAFSYWAWCAKNSMIAFYNYPATTSQRILILMSSSGHCAWFFLQLNFFLWWCSLMFFLCWLLWYSFSLWLVFISLIFCFVLISFHGLMF